MSLTAEFESLGIDPKELQQIARAETKRRQKEAYLLADPFAFHLEMVCPPRWVDLIADLHAEMLEFMQGGKRFKLMLVPRGHLKTSVLTQGETTRRVLANPDLRVQINTAVSANSQRFLSAIKGTMRQERFTKIFGDLLPPPNSKYLRNNNSELTITTRTNLSLREPTFSATGVGEAQTSQHYDLIVHDDLMNRENVTNIEQIEKVITHYKDSLDLLEPDGEMWVIGTRWHPHDISGWILEGFIDKKCAENDYKHVSNDCTCMFDVMLRTVEENGKYIFPKKFNAQVLDDLSRQKGRYEIACQYYNNPVDPSACWFSHKDIKEAEFDTKDYTRTYTVDGKQIEETWDELRKRLLWYIAVDPAESIEKRASFTAAIAVGIDMTQSPPMWYVDYAKRDKVETAGFITLCMETHRRYPNHVAFGMEQNTRKALSYVLKERMFATNDLFQITELNPSDVRGGNKVLTKGLRIKRLLPLFEFKRIKINNQLNDLLDELYTLPSATSWDLTDALQYVLSMAPEGAGGVGNCDPTNLPVRTIGWQSIGY